MTVYEIIQEFIKKNNYIQDEHVLRKNKDLNYIWKYDNNKSLKEQKIHKDTIHILSYINTEFSLLFRVSPLHTLFFLIQSNQLRGRICELGF